MMNGRGRMRADTCDVPRPPLAWLFSSGAGDDMGPYGGSTHTQRFVLNLFDLSRLIKLL